MRVRTLTFIALLLGALIAIGTPAMAQDDHEDEAPETMPTPPEGAVGIGDNIWLTSAVITPPDGGAPREFDAYDTAVFVQSWLPTSVWGGHDIERTPSAPGPIYRVDIEGMWANAGVGVQTVYYTVEGDTPYINFPQTQAVSSGPSRVTPPPAESDWFVAQPRVVDAFNGEAELIETQGTAIAEGTATTTTTSPDGTGDGEEATAASSDSDSFPTWAWLVIAAAAAAVVVLIVRTVRRRPASA